MSSCRPVSDTLIFSVNVFTHVLILFIFLTAFFILFVSKLTKDMFETEISHLIDGSIDVMLRSLDDDTKKKLVLFTNAVPLEKLINKYKDPSEYVLEHNKWVGLSAMTAALVGIIILVLILYVLYNTCGRCVPLKEILLENVIVFACVGVVEYLFFTRIALKFVPAPPSLLVSSLINKFKSSIVENTN